MPSYIDVDNKKHLQLDDGALVPCTVTLAMDGGQPVTLLPAQVDLIKPIPFPTTFPLPASQVTDLKSVSVSNWPGTFAISNWPTSTSVSNWPTTYALPSDQASNLNNISQNVSSWTRGSGGYDVNTLRVTIATNQPKIPVVIDTSQIPLSVTTQDSSGTVATRSQVAASTTTVTIAAADTNRKALKIYNNSSADLYVGLGLGATLSSFTVKLGSGDYYEVPTVDVRLTVTGAWSSAVGNAQVTATT